MRTPPSPDLVTLFQALGDRTRLRLLNLMRDGELCVCYFVGVLAEGQPKISRHLAYLRKSGLVTTRRDGKWIHYTMTPPQDPAAAAVFRTTLEQMQHDPEMQRDRKTLELACCAVSVLNIPEDAPRPQARR